eukprot:TRINITY_DN10142_c2_g1_i1.p1 TRINITY_DN10142_c2_g1~~TRINITY_DN10142_c2_g1_i1.p1  ORF type:complete len:501 (+),score=110.25 TRINITY_DN10142_c2_g1_i1:65-1567(+)
MAKARKQTSRRITTKQRAKVTKKVSRFKREARRTAKKLRKSGNFMARKEKDPALSVPNSWPNKEKILLEAQREREIALLEKQHKKAESKKAREWAKKNPEQARIKKARAEARALQLEEARKEAARKAQCLPSQIETVLPKCNAIFQVLDVRAPLSSISKSMEAFIESQQADIDKATPKVIVYILNKVDLVSRDYVESWVKALQGILVDNPKLLITRKIAVYSKMITESPGCLMQVLQTDWLKNSKQKKIVACVLGQPNTGKHSIIRDLEVTASTVSVHASSQVTGNNKTRIPGSRDFAVISMPVDEKRVAEPITGFDCIFKKGEVACNSDFGSLIEKHLNTAAFTNLSIHYKIARVESASQLLTLLAKKRGIKVNDALQVLYSDISTGKLPIVSAIPAAGSNTKPREITSPVFTDVLKHCSRAKLLQVPCDAFNCPDFSMTKRNISNQKAPEDDDESESNSDYEFYAEDWQNDAQSGDEEMEDNEEFEEFEESQDEEMDG